MFDSGVEQILLERVAKAIAQVHMSGAEQKQIDRQWSRYLAEAGAAIRAMREGKS